MKVFLTCGAGFVTSPPATIVSGVVADQRARLAAR